MAWSAACEDYSSFLCGSAVEVGDAGGGVGGVGFQYGVNV